MTDRKGEKGFLEELDIIDVIGIFLEIKNYLVLRKGQGKREKKNF